MKYQIVSDGCCDLTEKEISQYHLRIVPFYVSFDQQTYYKEIEEIGIREVYDEMVVKHPEVFPKTSLPSMQDYLDVFQEYYDQDTAVICICFTPALSGSYNCACNARDIFLEEHPDAHVTVINSQAGTVTQALMVIEAGRMQKAGISYEESVRILEEMKKSNRIFFTVGNLDYLLHGGRIGRLAGLAASALSLKPMITLIDGEITKSGVARSRKKTVKKTIDLMENHFKDSGEDPARYQYAVGYGFDIEEGKKFYQNVVDVVKEHGWADKVLETQIGATIAVHTGPHAIGIGIIKRYEEYL